MVRVGGTRGFTLVEALVTLAVFSIAALLIAPPLQNMIIRSKLEGVTRETSRLVQLARMESTKRSVQSVVRVDASSGEIFAFADFDGATATDPPDGIFNPVAGVQSDRTDYLIGRSQIPAGVLLSAPESQLAAEGLTTVGSEKVIRLMPDGSVDVVGAYRFADTRGNFLEIRVEPKASARVTVRKWDEEAQQWWSRGEGGHPWEWH